MSKLATLIVLTLLLVSTLCFASRSGPAFTNDSPVKTQVKCIETEQTDQVVEDSCEGVGDEECLMRRTLAAHIDYIYTQKQKP